MRKIVYDDNLPFLKFLPDGFAQLIYIDPPFNTGKDQKKNTVVAVRDELGYAGFGGHRYRRDVVSKSSYSDSFGNEYLEFLEPRLSESYRVLSDNGSLFFHIDYREAHYCKILLDSIFGRESFINEIIWAFDYGGRSKKKWAAKHQTIFWYAKNPSDYVFHYDEIDRVPYLAPGLVGEEKAKRGKAITDVWWNTIVTGKEKTGYPTQKPLKILERIVRMHSNPNDMCLDFFAGSGSFAEAAERLGRQWVAVDNSRAAIRTMKKRLAFCKPEYEENK